MNLGISPSHYVEIRHGHKVVFFNRGNMELSEKQIQWLKKATAKDLLRAMVAKEWDRKTYSQIEKKWLDLRQHQRNSIFKKAEDPHWWEE